MREDRLQVEEVWKKRGATYFNEATYLLTRGHLSGPPSPPEQQQQQQPPSPSSSKGVTVIEQAFDAAALVWHVITDAASSSSGS
jgi:hypothetical protein